MDISFIILTIISCVVGFISSYLMIPKFKIFLHNIDILAIDQQKKNKPRIATSGGIPIALSFFLAIMTFLILRTYLRIDDFSFPVDNNYIIAASLTSLFIAVIGFFDDIYTKRTKSKTKNDTSEYRIGLSQWMKPLLTLPAAFPLIITLNSYSNLLIPLVGKIQLGILMPLLVIPIFVIGISNAFNMLAGKNGLEAGMAIQAFIFLGIIGLLLGKYETSLISFTAASCLIAFIIFNWHPASILPGDSLTYFAGGVFASSVMLGGSKIIFYAGIIFIPWLIEGILKLRGGFRKKSLGELQADGTLKAPYNKIYSLNHIVMKLPEWLNLKKRFKENQVALTIIIFGSITSLISLIIALSNG